VLLRRREWADPDEAAAAGGPTTGGSNTERPLGYDARDTVASLVMGVGMLLVNAGVGRLLAPGMHWLYEHRVLHLGGRPDPATGRTPHRALLAAVLLWDFAFYWEHRLSHEHRVMWAAHVNHHSSRYFNLGTALRQSWTGFVGDWVYAPLLVLGFSPAQVAKAAQLDLLYQFWVHTELVERLPRCAEWALSTPAHHRVHHARDAKYLDKIRGNMAKAQGKCLVMTDNEISEKSKNGIIEGQFVYVCCPPCVKKMTASPEKFLAVLDDLYEASLKK
jgi:hypothetical protein